VPRPADKTPWFKGSVHPVRPGVYERKMPSGAVLFCEWTGVQWLTAANTPRRAEFSVTVTGYQNRPWRGLIKENSNV